MDDRAHRLLHCPRFTSLHLRLSLDAAAAVEDPQPWTWTFLMGSGRRFLARFLDPARDALQPGHEDEDVEEL